MLTRSWAREFGPQGVRVNALAPGLVQTDFSEFFWKNEQHRDSMLGRQALRHLGQPDEIGYAALYLASPGATYVTGETLRVDGGFLAGRL